MKNVPLFLILLIVLFLFQYPITAQQNKIDSLLQVLKTTKEDTSHLNTLNEISIHYINISGYKQALQYALQAQQQAVKLNYRKGIAASYSNIGVAYWYLGNYKKALDYQLKSLKISEAIGDTQLIAMAYGNVGIIYMNQNKFEESIHSHDKALELNKKIGYKAGIRDVYSYLSDVYEKKGDYKQAYIYHKLFSDIKDTLLNEESSKQITEMNTKYDSEKKDKELIQKDSEINKQQAERERKNLQINAFIISFLLVLVLAFFIYRSYRQKQIANKQLEEKNELIEKQKQLVEEKNTKITDSINYAKRIQQATLPSDKIIKSHLPDTFIISKPKDIVSGDFYWFAEKENKLLIAIADCTGHGVPGAFMSMIGNTLLNEIINVKKIYNPNQILNGLNKGIVNLLHQTSSDINSQDDGMDITILSIDKAKNEIEFAGANHFSYIISPTHLKILKGDVYSIGGMFGKADINFSSQKIKIETGSMLYLFTDGFIDQFGGEKNTKFLSGRFEQLLKNIQQYSVEQQRDKLVTAFDDWKGKNKQLDDVLVVGIKI